MLYYSFSANYFISNLHYLFRHFESDAETGIRFLSSGMEDVGGVFQQIHCQASDVVNQLQVFEFRLVSVDGQGEVAWLFTAETELQSLIGFLHVSDGVILAFVAHPKARLLCDEATHLLHAVATTEVHKGLIHSVFALDADAQRAGLPLGSTRFRCGDGGALGYRQDGGGSYLHQDALSGMDGVFKGMDLPCAFVGQGVVA